jgi:hypothetical protein
MYGNSRLVRCHQSRQRRAQLGLRIDTIKDCTPAVLTGNRGYCAMNPYWRAVPDQK